MKTCIYPNKQLPSTSAYQLLTQESYRAQLNLSKQCSADALHQNSEARRVIRYMCCQDERHLHAKWRALTHAHTEEAASRLVKRTFNKQAESKTCLLSFIPLLIFCSHLFLQASFHILASFFFPSVKGTFIKIHALKDRRPRPHDNRATYLPSSFMYLFSLLPPDPLPPLLATTATSTSTSTSTPTLGLIMAALRWQLSPGH